MQHIWGIDLGGTKIEGVLMQGSKVLQRLRLPTPQGDYPATLHALADVVLRLEQAHGCLPVGLGHPGAISRKTGLIKNANSTCLNGQALGDDLSRLLNRPINRPINLANDADCLALSEASDGAGAGHHSVFAAILGTGVGAGVCIGGRLLQGPNGLVGEWGHNPLPWPSPDEYPGPLGWDGKHGSIESWLSGEGLADDHQRVNGGERLRSETLVQQAENGDPACEASLQRYEQRLAKALASVINLLDPEVIVLGGGMSRVQRLYENVPKLWGAWVFSDQVDTLLKPALHGDSSGVRGAAWLGLCAGESPHNLIQLNTN